MNTRESEALKALWTPKEQLPDCHKDNLYQQQALEQYKLYVDIADRTSTRRTNVNSFMQTLHTAFLGAIATAAAKGDIHLLDWSARLLLTLPLAALMLSCYVWYRLVQSFDQLNSAKFKVIGALEERLPASPWWRAEWRMLGHGDDPRLYRPMTHLERQIPWIMLGFYVLIGLLIVTYGKF